MKLMIVESPSKIKKIESILGADWKVVASYGHVRDLPPKELGIDLSDFALSYEYLPGTRKGDRTFPGSAERVGAIRKLIGSAQEVYLATDPDREGEAISWHLRESLGLSHGDYVRITFGEITSTAVKAAVTATRGIYMDLVRAQEARRALDRMVGWLVSPVLSDTLGRNVSAGRVQSLVVRLIVDLERNIRDFKSIAHFGAAVTLDDAGSGKAAWNAAWDTTDFTDEGEPYVRDEALALKASQCRRFEVLASESKDTRQGPPSPFNTALLLRAGTAKLKLSVSQIEKAAQKLYDNGHVNYIRTDSVNISEEAVPVIRSFVQSLGHAVPETHRKWKEKDSAQVGHEAIRPIAIDVEDAGDDDIQRALYRLIRERTLASQMADATYRVNSVRLLSVGADEPFEFTASGRVVTSPGWRALTAGDAIEDDADKAEPENKVPTLQVGAIVEATDGKLQRKKTEPPRRYTQSTLVKKLEDEGVGRPATYPSIINTIQVRGYVELDKQNFVPTALGELVTDVLVRAKFSFMDVDFTRQLESQLDGIAQGQQDYVAVVQPAYNLLREELARIGESGEFAPAFKCPKCSHGLRLFTGSAARAAYWRCTNAEQCGHFMDDANGRPIERPVHPCPTCATAMRRYKRKSGTGHLWVCPGEGCDTMLDDVAGKPVGVHKCSKCTTPLRRYQKRNKSSQKLLAKWGWFCPNKEGGCTNFMDDDGGKPVPVKVHPCPTCQKAMYLRDGEHGKFWGCSGYRDGCKTVMDDKGGKPVPRGSGSGQRTKTAAKKTAKGSGRAGSTVIKVAVPFGAKK